MAGENIFETDNLDLGAYLMQQGIRYMGCKIEYDASRRRPKATMKFLDDRQNARDLERCFMTSPEKRYRDLTKYLLKEVHREVRHFQDLVAKQIIEPEEE